MKLTVIIIFLLTLTVTGSRTFRASSVSAKDYPAESLHFQVNDLVSFLDSVAGINPDPWAEELSFMTDSTLNYQTDLNHILSRSEFEQLKIAVRHNNIDIDLVKRVFPKLKTDSILLQTLTDNRLPIHFYSFDEHDEDFREYAILIGYDDGLSWINDVYFFYGDRIIAKHNIFHRYGLDIKHFKDENNRTVIYYKVNYGSGTGIWWNQFNFYGYDRGRLVPVLTEIQDINLQYPWGYRAYRIESDIISERPLRFKFIHNIRFADSTAAETDFIADSAVVAYYVDVQSGKFIPDFKNTGLTRNRLLSYYHSDKELFFVNSYYDLFKHGLYGKDHAKRGAILYYLSELKSRLEGR